MKALIIGILVAAAFMSWKARGEIEQSSLDPRDASEMLFQVEAP